MKSEREIIDIYTKVILRVALVALACYVLYIVRDIIALFFVAVVVMAAIDPIVSWFGRSRIPRPLGVLLIYLVLVLIFGTAFSVLVPAIVAQSKAFMDELPRYLSELNSILIGVNIDSYEVASKVGEGISGSSFDIFSKTIGVFSAAFSFLIVLSMAFYMSIIKNGMEIFLKSVTPKNYEEKVVRVAIIIKEKIGRWMLGQLLLMFVIFSLDYIVLSLIDVPYALAIAIIGGILEIIPYAGPVASTTVAALIGFFTSPVKGVLVLISYVVIQQAENHIIVPQIMKKAVGLNPLVIIFSVLVGVKIAGVAGAILAVPVATAISVVIENYPKEK